MLGFASNSSWTNPSVRKLAPKINSHPNTPASVIACIKQAPVLQLQQTIK